jgi:DNA-3-methyladenine glycosylase
MTIKNTMARLENDFYLHDDVVALSRALIGKMLFTQIDGAITGGYIIETEAYRGPEDRASHAFNNRRTKRTEVMFQRGGLCYVYKCYGIHNLLNIVTNVENIPHAILIRGILPKVGKETIMKRRLFKDKIIGPGNVAKGLSIDMTFNFESLFGEKIWIEESADILQGEIFATPRIGIDYAKEDALLPWRFELR